MNLPLKLIPEHITQFRYEFDELCKRFDITEVVALAQYGDNHSFILHGSLSGYSNETYNSIEIAIRAILEDINAKIENKPEQHG